MKTAGTEVTQKGKTVTGKQRERQGTEKRI